MRPRKDKLTREIGGVVYEAKLARTGRWLIQADGEWLYGETHEKAMALLRLKDKRWVRKSHGRPPTYTAVRGSGGGWVIEADGGRIVFDPERKKAMKQLGLEDPVWVPPKRKNIVEIEQDSPEIPFDLAPHDAGRNEERIDSWPIRNRQLRARQGQKPSRRRRVGWWRFWSHFAGNSMGCESS